MSVKATARAWESGASGNELLVLLALADHAGGENDPYDYAYPSVGTVAQMTKASPRTVQRSLRSLEEQGRIRKTGEHVWAPGKVTGQYRIEPPTADNLTGRQIGGGDTAGTDGVSPVTPNPPIEPVLSLEERAGEKKKRKSMSYRGKAIPDAIVQVAERLLTEFSAQTHRQIGSRTADGTASPALKQIVGAMLTRPDVTEQQWTAAIRKTVSTPPGWVDGRQLQLGDVFGERAAEWALAPADRSDTVGRTRSTKGRDFSRFDRNIE